MRYGVNFRTVSFSFGEVSAPWRLVHDRIGPPDCPYMRRTFVQTPIGTVRLHRFLRSDDDRAFHDHPWSFVTLVLRGSYQDLVPCPTCDGTGLVRYQPVERWARGAYAERSCSTCVPHGHAGAVVGDRLRPGSIRLRRAHHVHRVVSDGATTIVVSGRKVRTWGFWQRGRWTQWRKYHAVNGYPACADVAPTPPPPGPVEPPVPPSYRPVS